MLKNITSLAEVTRNVINWSTRWCEWPTSANIDETQWNHATKRLVHFAGLHRQHLGSKSDIFYNGHLSDTTLCTSNQVIRHHSYKFSAKYWSWFDVYHIRLSVHKMLLAVADLCWSLGRMFKFSSLIDVNGRGGATSSYPCKTLW